MFLLVVSFFCSLQLDLFSFCLEACLEVKKHTPRVKFIVEIGVILEYPLKCYIALGKNIKQQCRCTEQHNGGAQHELISILGILCLFDFQGSWGEEESFQVVCHLNKSSLQHFFFFRLPIIVTGSNAKLCFALTYCPHHVVYVLVYVSVCAPVYVRHIDWSLCVCV